MLAPTSSKDCRTPTKCAVCPREFMQPTSFIKHCSPKCGIKLLALKAKAERADLKKRKEAARRPQDVRAVAQEAMNAWARARDYHLGCISCDKGPNWNGQWHGSHFRSVGAASAVRFNLWNIHKACSVCNHFKSGNVPDYEPRLRAKIGDEKVDWLYTQNAVTRYEIEYLDRLTRIARKRTRRLIARAKEIHQ